METKRMNDPEVWSPFVAKLKRDTLDGRMQWAVHRQSNGRDDVVGQIYMAEILPEKFVAVYEYRYPDWIRPDEFVWDSEIAVEFVDSAGHLLWRLPTVAERFSLLDAVRYQAAAVEQIAADYLGKE